MNSVLPPFVETRITDWFGIRVLSATPVSGGMIAKAASIDTSQGRLFVKWSDSAPDRLYSEGGYGLWLIENTRTITVPRIIGVCDRTPDLPQEETPFTFLVMEYIESVLPENVSQFTRRFAEQLAAMHQAPPLKDARYGLKNDNFIGLSPQRNTPRTEIWSEFFRDCRLMPQIELARQNGHLSPEREQLLQTVVEKTPDLLSDIPPEVSLIHGDLWSGNFLCNTDEQPVLIDPSAYYGHREMEIAYVELFGGFPPNFVEMYRQVLPLDAGYLRRRPLHQLYHLLNHLNHFGEQYVTAVENACRLLLTLV